jgi:hypothetical protein
MKTILSCMLQAGTVFFTWPEGVTAWGIIFTLFVIAEQTRQTALAAAATRDSVDHGLNTSKRKQRAYLTVIIGGAVYQERRSEAKGGDLKFECRPLLVNTGKTPARKLKFKARAAIFPSPLPKETHLPEGFDDGVGDSILGPNQSANLSAIVDGFCADGEVAEVKSGSERRALYVWGLVTYEDIFGDAHFTRFCQHIYWDLKNNVHGHYIPGRNDMD